MYLLSYTGFQGTQSLSQGRETRQTRQAANPSRDIITHYHSHLDNLEMPIIYNACLERKPEYPVETPKTLFA